VLGAEHPHTLGSASNLVVLLSEQGEFSESARIHRETLEVRRRVLGVEHPHTLGSSAGESAEAVRIQRETLEVRRRVLGAEHPDTLGSASNLAVVLSKQGGLSLRGWTHPYTANLQI